MLLGMIAVPATGRYWGEHRPPTSGRERPKHFTNPMHAMATAQHAQHAAHVEHLSSVLEIKDRYKVCRTAAM